MSGILWDELVFGPIRSRRLGNSLGVNLLPGSKKICTFNCVYCECGWGEEIENKDDKLPKLEKIIPALEKRLIELKEQKFDLNSITFAGNGEPSLHPEFVEIINNVLQLRDIHAPQAKVTCLSNSTMIHKVGIREALMKIDNPWMKLDAGSDLMYRRINKVFKNLSLSEIVENLIKMKGNLSIQTLLLRGEMDGEIIDNTSEKEVEVWIEHLKKIKPRSVILYPIDRETPLSKLEKISDEELEKIADKVRKVGINTVVYS
ncbi:MAG: radical SAM protein [Bacteroidales bacterium]|jgi:wyosine [tRNA(Phe)-imidazoG37] synthetase (radical SAM superfamily)|nr:radical SAM protein [Bacteroidales bacterium]